MTDADSEAREDSVWLELRRVRAEIGRRKLQGLAADDLIAQHRLLSSQLAANPGSAAGQSLRTGLRLEICSSSEAFADLRTEWGELVEGSNTYSPFLTWEWLFPWWQTYGPRHVLRLLMVRSASGRLLGIAPLMIRHEPIGRCLSFVGTGRGAPRANYLGLVIRNGFEADVRRCLADAIWEMAAEWTYAHFEHVSWRDEAPWLLEALLRPRKAHITVESEGCCICGDLPSTFQDYLASVPNERRRRYLLNQHKRLSAAYPSARFALCENPETVLLGFEALASMSVGRKASQGSTSSLANPEGRAFRARVAALFHEMGWLRLDTLVVDERPIAALMGVDFRGTYFAYQTGFDEQYSSIAPTHCLLGHRISRSIEDGVRRFDLLAGDAMYKRQYFAGLHLEVTLRVWPYKVASQVAAMKLDLRRLLSLMKRGLLRRN